MARCKGCGKWKWFSNFEKGLCSSCVDKLFPSGVGAFGLTKDMFLNPEKYIVEEEPIKRGTETEVPGMITAEDGNKIPISSLPNFYDLAGIKIIDNNNYEITSSENIIRAKLDIVSLNKYMDNAKRICRTIPDFRFSGELLNFCFDPMAFTRNYSMISFSPLTKTGKVAGRPITLHIVQDENLHGKIMYDGSGEIARAEISTITISAKHLKTMIKQDCRTHRIIIAKQNGDLKIRLIYRSNNGIKEKVYDSKQ